MHTLLFLEPEHFHAALTVREPHPLVSHELFVYATRTRDVAPFVALVESFNARASRPTRWRAVVRAGDRPLERLLAERAGDVVVVAGKNDRKMGWIRALHNAGLHVLADKPWITRPESVGDLRHVLSGGAVAWEMMTGRHEITSIVTERLVREPDVFGDLDTAEGEPAIRLTSVHHLEKRVNGAPLRRPPWYFDVQVQGDGLADIPTHLVDQAQRLLAAHDRLIDERTEIVAARCWATAVPRPVFARITGLEEFPAEIRGRVDGETLAYAANAELTFRVRAVTVHLVTRWELSEPPGGGDLHHATVSGTRARIHVAQGPETGFRRRVVVEPREEAGRLGGALAAAVAGWQADHPGLAVTETTRGFEIEIPATLRTGHESHFPLVLAECLDAIRTGRWPDARAADTLAKYELLARARGTRSA